MSYLQRKKYKILIGDELKAHPLFFIIVRGGEFLKIQKKIQTSFNKAIGWNDGGATSSNIVDDVVNALTPEQLEINQEKLKLIQQKLNFIKKCCKTVDAEFKTYDYTLARMGMSLSKALINNKAQDNIANIKMLQVIRTNQIVCFQAVEEILAILRGEPTLYAIYISDIDNNVQRIEYSANQINEIFSMQGKRIGLDAKTALSRFFDNAGNILKQESAASQIDISQHYRYFQGHLLEVVGGKIKSPGVAQEVFEAHYSRNYCKFDYSQQSKTFIAMANAADDRLQDWNGIRRLYFVRAADNLSWYSGGDIDNISVKSLKFSNIDRIVRNSKTNHNILGLSSERSLNDVINQLDAIFGSLDAKNNPKLTADMIRQILIPFTQTIETSMVGKHNAVFNTGMIDQEVNKIIKNLTK